MFVAGRRAFLPGHREPASRIRHFYTNGTFHLNNAYADNTAIRASAIANGIRKELGDDDLGIMDKRVPIEVAADE